MKRGHDPMKAGEGSGGAAASAGFGPVRGPEGIDGRAGCDPDFRAFPSKAPGARSPGPRGTMASGGRRGLFAGIALAAFVAACAPENPSGGESAPTTDAAPEFDPSLPPHSPARFGFGSAASEERIARWDIDVKPDGEGLPPGNGSVAEGAAIYERSCMQCHGPTGTEGPNDRLVATGSWDEWPPGRAIGAFWPWATTIFDYTRRAMPQLEPGTLTDDETYAVVAYILHLNGLLPADAVLDAPALAAIEMPARDRFVPDNRTGGSEIRE